MKYIFSGTFHAKLRYHSNYGTTVCSARFSKYAVLFGGILSSPVVAFEWTHYPKEEKDLQTKSSESLLQLPGQF